MRKSLFPVGIAARAAQLRGSPSCALVIALVAALPVAVSAAPASSPMGSEGIAEFAACLATRHRREAADYVLRTNVPIASTIRAERRLADRACVPARSTRDEAKALLKLPQDLRPALAEALVREEFPTFEAGQIGAAQPPGSADLVESLWPAGACSKCSAERLREFDDARAKAAALTAPLVSGTCAVRADPANAHRLLLTQAGSAEEKAALRSLEHAFEHCGVEGGRAGTSLTAVRHSIALNYYRLARAKRVQPASGAAR